MPTSADVILSTIDGASDRERLLLVLCQQEGESRLELRQQSFGDGIGWFNQSTIALEPHQVAELRSALGTSGSRRPSSLPKPFRRVEPAAWQPRVVQAETA
jgi:hypothetical protein